MGNNGHGDDIKALVEAGVAAELERREAEKQAAAEAAAAQERQEKITVVIDALPKILTALDEIRSELADMRRAGEADRARLDECEARTEIIDTIAAAYNGVVNGLDVVKSGQISAESQQKVESISKKKGIVYGLGGGGGAITAYWAIQQIGDLLSRIF